VPRTINVRIPLVLKELRESVGVGLLHLAYGEESFESINVDNSTNLEQTSISLTAESVKYLEIIKKREGITQQKIITNALSWVSLQPPHVQQSRI
jgi:hypothetical protein